MKFFKFETREDLEMTRLMFLALFLVLFFTVSALTPSEAIVNAENPHVASPALIALPLEESATGK